MSLTSIINKKNVRLELNKIVRKPIFSTNKSKPLISSCFDDGPWIGTAFDYIFRFGLIARGYAKSTSIVASHGLLSFRRPYKYSVDSAEVLNRYRLSLLKLDKMRESRKLRRDSASAAFTLSRFDVFYRAPAFSIDEKIIFQEPSSKQISELQSLYEIIPWEIFKPKKSIFLNPTFNHGSLLVGGADCDLIIDNKIIDIKTVNRNSISIGDIRQLLGYYILAKNFGISGSRSKFRGNKLGVYLSRHGKVMWFSVHEVLKEKHERKFLLALVGSDYKRTLKRIINRHKKIELVRMIENISKETNTYSKENFPRNLLTKGFK
jgi:hypothetical protein